MDEQVGKLQERVKELERRIEKCVPILKEVAARYVSYAQERNMGNEQKTYHAAAYCVTQLTGELFGCPSSGAAAKE